MFIFFHKRNECDRCIWNKWCNNRRNEIRSWFNSYNLPHSSVSMNIHIIDQLPCTGIARSQIQILLKSWIFFRLLKCNCIKCVHYCEDHSSFDICNILLSTKNLHFKNFKIRQINYEKYNIQKKKKEKKHVGTYLDFLSFLVHSHHLLVVCC